MHCPVMMAETLDGLQARPGGRYIDATLGGAGHAEAILRQSSPDGRLLGLDADPEAVARAQKRLAPFGERVVVRHARFSLIAEQAETAGFTEADGILFDLGVSSFQLDEDARGFSFMREGPLDMRMDPGEPVTAAELVNGASERDLADWIYRLGEESASRRIAQGIVRARTQRRIETTGELAAIVEAAKGGRHGRLHPATKTFQALRMAVNRELPELEAALEAALPLLRLGGRLVVIAFHSLEDRIVKTFFKRHEGRMEALPLGGARWDGALPPVKRITRKPLGPTPEDVRDNPRARSAKLRVAERCEETTW